MRNPKEVQVQYYCSLRGALGPIFPLATHSQAHLSTRATDGSFGVIAAFQNPNSFPVTVRALGRSRIPNQTYYDKTITLAGFEFASETLSANTTSNEAEISSSAPIRMLRIEPPSLGTLLPVATPMGASPASYTLTANPSSLRFQALVGGSPPPAQSVALSYSGGGALPFKTKVLASGGNWLSIDPSIGNTPAKLTVTVNPVGLALGTYFALIQTYAPNYAPYIISISVTLSVLTSTEIIPTPASLAFSAPLGGPPPRDHIFSLTPAINGQPSVSTENGVNWLKVRPAPGITGNQFYASADPTGLAAGSHRGTVTVSSSGATVQIPVTLTVWSTPPPLTATPSSLTFNAENGLGSYVLLESAGIPVDVTGLCSEVRELPVTPAFCFVYSAPSPVPRIFNATLVFTTTAGSVPVPVTETAPSRPPLVIPSPVVASIVNGASQRVGAVAPGEILTINGQAIGPLLPAGFTLDPTGRVSSTLGGLQVLFDGIMAPVLYASQSQVNVIVPYEIEGRSVTNIQVSNSEYIGVPVTASAPAIFTIDGAGVGSAAVLNQDNSLNNSAHPAARGAVIQIFATGEGVTEPAGVTGSVTYEDLKMPTLPVAVTIGGIDAQVLYAGSAAGSVTGLFQVNAVVPPGVTPGLKVPIRLTVGPARSQDAVTIAVQ